MSTPPGADLEAYVWADRTADVVAERAADRRRQREARREARQQARKERADARARAGTDAQPSVVSKSDVVAPEESSQVRDRPPSTRGDSRRQARAERAAARSAARAAKRDRIVEAPRAPRMSLSDRLRSRGGAAAGDGSATSRDGRKRLVSLLAAVIGAAGLICSVVLALGALLVALDATSSSAYDMISGVCDVLVGPLRDAFSFSGAKAEMKESLVVWGAGAVAYLVVGIVAQSLLRSVIDD
jgi:hypothetical protein